MKHTIWYLSILLVLLIIACKEEEIPDIPEEPIPPVLGVEQEVKALTLTHTVIHDIESIVLNQLHIIEESDPSGEAHSLSHLTGQNDFLGIGSCALSDLNDSANELVLDFGSGCVDMYGALRAGKIQINYESSRNDVGNMIEVVMTDFQISKITINGSMQMEKTLDDEPQYVEGYRYSWQDLLINTETDSIQINGERDLFYEHNIQGRAVLDNTSSLSIKNELNGQLNDLDFSFSTQYDLKYTARCWLNGNMFPYSGLSSLQLDGKEYVLAFQNCNYTFLVIDEDGEEYLLDLRK